MKERIRLYEEVARLFRDGLRRGKSSGKCKNASA